MNRRNRFPKLLTVSLMSLLLAAGAARAFDHLEITVIDPVVVEGHPAVTVQQSFDVQVRAVNADGTTDTDADYIHAVLSSPDVPASLPSAAYLQSGERIFTGLQLLADGQPVRVRVADQDDPSVPFAETLLNCYRPVDHFDIAVPAGDKYVGQTITLTVTARDDGNQPVKNFADNVVLRPDVGHFTAGPTVTMGGGSFSLGVGTVDVIFQGTDPATHQNTVTATNSVTYSGQAGPADGSALVAPLYPGALARIVLLLPGESLTPGVSPGKSGAPLPQSSGFAFNGIDVWAVDQYWNPVDAGPYPDLHWVTDDGSAGVLLPADGTMTSNLEANQSVTLIQAGQRQITVQASGPITAASTSYVQINPGGLDHFAFDYAVFDTSAVRVTTTPFPIRVIAYDSAGNIFPFNGPVSMRARIGASDESADYLITSSNVFVDGVLNASVQVTKRAFSVRLVIDSNAGATAVSGDFQVNAGPMEKVLFTFPGETWTPGLSDTTFSGNLGTPNSSVTGMTVTPTQLRAVDRYGNLVSGSRVVTITCPTGYYALFDDTGSPIPNGVITLSGTGSYRVAFMTAGEQRLRGSVSGLRDSYSSIIIINPGTYTRLVVVAPGESLDPGTLEATGKIGTPTVQDAGAGFNVTAYATDYFFNPVASGDAALPLTVNFSSSDPAAVVPGGDQVLYTGSASFPVTLVTLANPNQQVVRVEDPGTGRYGTAVIPLQAGIIDHFDIGIDNSTNPDPTLPLDPVPDIQAGSWLPNVTVIARDAYGNHIASFTDSVTLSVNLDGQVLEPVRVSLADGYGSGGLQGVWRGSLRISRSDTAVVLTATEDIYGRSGDSNPFTVFPGAYAGLRLLLSGETATPGEAPGKFGAPLPIVAGDTLVANVQAVDALWNPVPEQPVVHLGVTGFGDLLSANDVALDASGAGSWRFVPRTAAPETVTVQDLVTPARTDTSRTSVTPGPLYRIQIVAPGETPQPGGPELDGKIGSPTPQIATLQFPVTALAVDRFWNRVDVNDHRVHLTSSDGSLGQGNPLNNNQFLQDGRIDFPIDLSTIGLVDLTAVDLDDATVLGHTVTVQVTEGAQYRITNPDTVHAGPPSTFVLSVALVDENGVLQTNAFHDIALRPLTATLQPAPGTLLVTQAVLDSGRVDIAAQAYDTPSRLVVEVSDASGRIGYSDVIEVLPNATAYVVTVDLSPPPVVGPPATFPVSVRLVDTETGAPVDDDRAVQVRMVDQDGNAVTGALGVTTQRLAAGAVDFSESFTTAGTFAVEIADSTGLTGRSPLFILRPAGYEQLQVVVPGETPRPGDPAFADVGKSGTPAAQRPGVDFPVTVMAVDHWWNPVDTTSVAAVHLAAADGSFDLPHNPDVNDVPLLAGQRTFHLFLSAQGEVALSAVDTLRPALPGQTVRVPTLAPYAYEITVPDSAQTGGVPGFTCVVRLLNPDDGSVVTGAGNPIRLEPVRSDFGPAAGQLGVTGTSLVDGAAVITGQSYDTLEDIRIRVSDDFGRTAVSAPVHMLTGGLYYAVTVPDTAVVGGPTTFPLRIELIDSNTGQRVTGQDNLVSIRAFNAATGDTAAGVLGVGQQMVVDGYNEIPESYTLAEQIYLEVSDGLGHAGVSNSCRLLPDGFKQLQLVVPGETVDPGAESGTGKTGQPLVQTAGLPFTVEIRAVDQFWNVVASLNDGAITLNCSSPELLHLVNPGDDAAPFVGGRRQVPVVLDGAGNLSLVAADVHHPLASEAQVTIPVAEAVYEVTAPDTVFVGPPATFTVHVRLLNPSTGEPVPAGDAFTMTALRSDLSEATATLGVGEGSLVMGEAQVTGQTYGASEEIVIRVADARGRTADSAPITVIPLGVTYAIVAPDTVIAGEPWSLEIRRVDVNTGLRVTGFDQTFSLSAINAWSGAARPDPQLTPAGDLRYTFGTTVDGTALLPDQVYDRAESIYLRVTDTEGGDELSHLITVRSAAAQDFSVSLRETDGAPLERPLRPGDRAVVFVQAADGAGNPADGAQVRCSLVDGDGGFDPTGTAEVSLTTGVEGTVQAVVQVNQFGERDLLIEAQVDAITPRQVLAHVAGPPHTTIALDGVSNDYQDGLYVSDDTEISLTAVAGVPQMGVSILFDVDAADGALPQSTYTAPFTLADLVSGEPGLHVLRYRAVEDGGVGEAVHTVNLYTTRALSSDKPISNRPNPFRAGRENTIILFNPPRGGTATLTIYDLYGTKVLTERLDASGGRTAQFVWDGRNGRGDVVANGGYVCRITGPGYDLRRKIAVVK